MKIQPLLNNEFTRKKRLETGYNTSHPNSSAYNIAEMCDITNTRGYSASFSGKLPNETGTAAKSFMGRIMNSRPFHWLTGFAGEHNVATASLIALFLAGGLRPALTIALPGKDDLEDKIFAASHSMASGIIGFAFSTLITTPIDTGIKFIFNDSKKMLKEDYDKLTVGELAEHIRKNNLTPEKIAEKMKSETLSEEAIIKALTDESGNALNSEQMAEYVKANKGQIISTRNPKNKFFTIITSKVDEINKLKHELAQQTDMLEKGKLLSKIRNLENHMKGTETTMHNIAEWAIAIPRAMLTIALIPPILKYVFHMEKKKSKPEPVAQAPTQTPEDNAALSRKLAESTLSSSKFKGIIGGKN